VLQRLVDEAFTCDELLTLWACHILGYDSGLPKERSDEIISTSLMSDNPRDRAMAGFLSGKTSDSSFALKQSSVQTKLRGMLEQQYRTLHAEFPVEPGLVVDFASVKDRLAIEVNGPSHYLMDLASGESVMNGPSKHKLHQIESAGWKVKSINIMDLRRTQYSKFMHS
jgi:very-short-patch-repair endonuclease